MDNNNGNFNYEDYQKKHEGILQRIWRKLDKLKWLKRIFTLAFLGILIAAIGVVKQFYTTDAGKVIEELYQDAKDDIAETRQNLTYVQLPDSLEETSEVQKLRLFQNRVYSFNLLYISIVKEPHYYRSKKKSSNNQNKEYVQLASSWIQNLKFLGNRSNEIVEEGMEIIKYFTDKEDSLAIRSINLFTIAEVLHFQEDFNDLLSETSDKMSIKIKEKDINGSIDVVRELLSDKKLYNCYKSLHRNHLMLLNAVNIRLINIKNKEIEKKHGRFKKSVKRDVFFPSF